MKRKKIGEKRKELKKSVFIVNKLYLWVIFLSLSIADLTLGMFSLLVYFFIYLLHIFTKKLPIETADDFRYITKVYKRIEDDGLKLDIWYPNNIKDEYPLVVFAHGGGWISGFRNQPNNISWCKYLASKGFATASIDYRFGLKNNMQDILSDYSDALIFLKNHAKELRICPQNIILMGLSAGGHLSLLYAAYYSYKQDREHMEGIQGVVAYYAPSHLEDLLSTESRSLFTRFATIKTMKGHPKKQGADYRYYSPIEWISKYMPPTLLVHGKKDTTVPFSSATNLAKKLKEYAVSYRLLVHPSGEHCFEMSSKDFQTVRILNSTIKWMKERI